MNQSWISVESFIRKVGDGKIVRLFQSPDIRSFNNKGGSQLLCPLCSINLNETSYMGAPILRCPSCAGCLLREGDVQKILARDDYNFSPEIVAVANRIIQQQNAMLIKPVDMKTAALLRCPRCPDPKPQTVRNFYTLAYPVEVDRCIACQSIWFDRNELQILRCLISKNLLQNR